MMNIRRMKAFMIVNATRVNSKSQINSLRRTIQSTMLHIKKKGRISHIVPYNKNERSPPFFLKFYFKS